MGLTKWTCVCGKEQWHRGAGTPVCEECRRAAEFTVPPPRGQRGFDFGEVVSDPGVPRRTGYEE